MTRPYVNYDARSKLIARFVTEFAEYHGFPPSAQEIADECGVSRPHIHALLDRMEEDGLIERQRTPFGSPAPRGIRITRANMIAPLEEM
jgi:DNA-binding MarR family transcriptional regulator